MEVAAALWLSRTAHTSSLLLGISLGVACLVMLTSFLAVLRGLRTVLAEKGEGHAPAAAPATGARAGPAPAAVQCAPAGKTAKPSGGARGRDPPSAAPAPPPAGSAALANACERGPIPGPSTPGSDDDVGADAVRRKKRASRRDRKAVARAGERATSPPKPALAMSSTAQTPDSDELRSPRSSAKRALARVTPSPPAPAQPTARAPSRPAPSSTTPPSRPAAPEPKAGTSSAPTSATVGCAPAPAAPATKISHNSTVGATSLTVRPVSPPNAAITSTARPVGCSESPMLAKKGDAPATVRAAQRPAAPTKASSAMSSAKKPEKRTPTMPGSSREWTDRPGHSAAALAPTSSNERGLAVVGSPSAARGPLSTSATNAQENRATQAAQQQPRERRRRKQQQQQHEQQQQQQQQQQTRWQQHQQLHQARRQQQQHQHYQQQQQQPHQQQWQTQASPHPRLWDAPATAAAAAFTEGSFDHGTRGVREHLLTTHGPASSSTGKSMIWDSPRNAASPMGVPSAAAVATLGGTFSGDGGTGTQSGAHGAVPKPLSTSDGAHGSSGLARWAAAPAFVPPHRGGARSAASGGTRAEPRQVSLWGSSGSFGSFDLKNAEGLLPSNLL